MTGKVFQRERLVIISSVMPSAKYSCSGSLLIFMKGNTAIAGGLEASSIDFDAGLKVGTEFFKLLDS